MTPAGGQRYERQLQLAEYATGATGVSFTRENLGHCVNCEGQRPGVSQGG